jgi:cytochrome c2
MTGNRLRELQGIRSRETRAHLIAFLESLTDRALIQDLRYSNPWE